MRTILYIALSALLGLGKLALRAVIKQASPEVRAALPPAIEVAEKAAQKTKTKADDKVIKFLKGAIGTENDASAEGGAASG